MLTAALLRNQIEASLHQRIPVALTPRLRPLLDRSPCGVAALDELLQGGLPVGALAELVGAECSGRTTAALAYLAALTGTGSVCAWIDASDALDPESLAASGADLARLLWVRCGPAQDLPEPAPETPSAPRGRTDAEQPPASAPLRHTGGGSPHPRSEGRDMPAAIDSVLRAHGGPHDRHDRQLGRQKIKAGTPSAPNRPLSTSPETREEQVNSDRLPPRRGHNLVLASQRVQPSTVPGVSDAPTHSAAPLPSSSAPAKPWQALDQAIRAADLLLQGGGFSTIVLDLGGVPPEMAWRIPLATWFRFRAACERTRASLLLLSRHPYAGSSAELVVRLHPGSMEARDRVMTGIRHHAVTERTRTQPLPKDHVIPIRKPPQRAAAQGWTSEAAWAHR